MEEITSSYLKKRVKEIIRGASREDQNRVKIVLVGASECKVSKRLLDLGTKERGFSDIAGTGATTGSAGIVKARAEE